mmetsp:Transcript_23829/g.43068  ORF Transcript_23829/g.43068 Transcript_23829/m.43068 type:complete len:201 (+) Transcript_23829:5506-6108(+)
MAHRLHRDGVQICNGQPALEHDAELPEDVKGKDARHIRDQKGDKGAGDEHLRAERPGHQSAHPEATHDRRVQKARQAGRSRNRAEPIGKAVGAIKGHLENGLDHGQDRKEDRHHQRLHRDGQAHRWMHQHLAQGIDHQHPTQRATLGYGQRFRNPGAEPHQQDQSKQQEGGKDHTPPKGIGDDRPDQGRDPRHQQEDHHG